MSNVSDPTRARERCVKLVRMTYSWKAAELRRCRATTKGGEPCRAWAIWGHSDQLCAAHAGVTGGPWRPRHERNYGQVQHARYSACTCPAYNWPHRPGGG